MSLQFLFIRNNPIHSQAFACGTASISWLEPLIRIREVIKALLVWQRVTSSKRKKTYSIGLISRCSHLFSTTNSKTYYYNDAADQNCSFANSAEPLLAVTLEQSVLLLLPNLCCCVWCLHSVSVTVNNSTVLS